MDNQFSFIARTAVLILLACLPISFLTRSFGNRPRSLRLANLAIFFGLTILVSPEVTLGLAFSLPPLVNLLLGCTRAVIGLAGIIIGIIALRNRRNGAITIMRPLIGIGLSLLCILFGLGLIAESHMMSPGTPWVYQSSDANFKITLPSARWKLAPKSNLGLVTFVYRYPPMRTSVESLSLDQTQADYQLALNRFANRVQSIPKLRDHMTSRDGETPSGDTYQYFTGMDESSDRRPVFVAHSIIWSPKYHSIMNVIFEGNPVKLSESGKAAESEAFSKAAESICLSAQSTSGKAPSSIPNP